jgi:hypothetical protein
MYRLILSVLVVLFLTNHAYATWSIEGATGGVYNFPISLHIDQHPFPAIDLKAHYETRPLTPPPYYLIRLGRWQNCKAWELEFIHHKLYLQNNPPFVKQFTITNGYNLVTINRAWSTRNHVIFRLGLGAVITHPESTIHGLKFHEKGGTLNNDGYYLSGPTGMVSVGKRWYLFRSLFVQFEGKLTASYARVRVAQGNADAPNVALHGLLGLGIDLFKDKNRIRHRS